ncbi:NGP1NT-domain-containing protein [Sistotremastrum suecicum HHB10207 ss-3]|uniref:Nucleolar GTP-binding protein 2 n=1 Tax=Sistotremastrum suecicum HHB10207 ss-3 TaxID=1314776 RepID=A0A166J2F2_9AGAM|nr:NGP1NT-domain-containing protein [Sistotremastrum suecicum HHB10207 ss-3]
MAPTKTTGASPKARSSTSKISRKRSASRVKMLNDGKPVYDRDGKIKDAAAFQKTEAQTKARRVQPDSRWFGNTRVISQTALDHFPYDRYSVLLKHNRLPISLLDDALNPNSQKVLETEPFGDTFGPKAQLKRPWIDVGSKEVLGQVGAAHDVPEANRRSRLIYGVLYKVIDSSDDLLHILDARDPLGPICRSVLEYIRKEKSHKQLVLIIDQCDLVPNWVTARYIQYFSLQYPTIKQISVGFIGCPNVGKSSVISSLKSGKVCRVAPIPGETKVQARRIYLIECPGIVPKSAHGSNTSTVLKGVLRVEASPVPPEHIAPLLERVKPLYVSRTYGIPLPEDGSPYHADQLLDQLSRKKGRILKGGEPDLEGLSKIILSDWVRSRIPFFVPPPERSDELSAKEAEQKRRTEIKDKAKASGTDEPLVPGVTQKLSGIIQKNTLVGEDARRLEEAEEALDDNQEHENHKDEGSDEDEAVSAEELVWSDVYPEREFIEAADRVYVADEEKKESNSDKKRKKKEADNDEEESKPAKEARMKTNKRKATNFFTNANVKNKNRNKAKLLEKLKGTKGRSYRCRSAKIGFRLLLPISVAFLFSVAR